MRGVEALSIKMVMDFFFFFSVMEISQFKKENICGT